VGDTAQTPNTPTNVWVNDAIHKLLPMPCLVAEGHAELMTVLVGQKVRIDPAN